MPKKCEKEQKFQSLEMKNEGGKKTSKHDDSLLHQRKQ